MLEVSEIKALTGGRRWFCWLFSFWRDLLYLFAHTVKPYEKLPNVVGDLPMTHKVPSDEQLQHCREMFNEEERRREFLEEKAQKSFNVSIFILTILSSVFVLFAKEYSGPVWIKNISFSVYSVCFICIVFSFLSSMRAVSVKASLCLGKDAVLDKSTHEFLTYNKLMYGQGLIYCASVNQKINNHLTDFVRATQIFSAIAMVFTFIASSPYAYSLVFQNGGFDNAVEAETKFEVISKGGDCFEVILDGSSFRLKQKPVTDCAIVP
ncbi:hypothetical protein [Thalassospira profundimaris]|uniref:hypothetical protein n=1 Tax=Thalassospira profundimaris TaxID=502049 RepID=UPI00028735C2|nr:hypothetical protein [Thalassospira profundimaris]EKF07342.1 hypothetical protein TH2_15667 [Thalassospira profundimaris WP0211]